MFNGKLKEQLAEMTDGRDFWMAEAKEQNELLQTLRRKMVDRNLAHEAELAKVSGKGQPLLMADWSALRKWRVTPWNGPVEFVTAHEIVHDLTTGWTMFYRKEPTSVTTLSPGGTSLYVPAQSSEYCVAQYRNLASIVEVGE